VESLDEIYERIIENGKELPSNEFAKQDVGKLFGIKSFQISLGLKRGFKILLAMVPKYYHKICSFGKPQPNP
jgi:hypothetical protein